LISILGNSAIQNFTSLQFLFLFYYVVNIKEIFVIYFMFSKLQMTQQALDLYGWGRAESAVAKLVFVVIFVRFKFDLNIQFHSYSL